MNKTLNNDSNKIAEQIKGKAISHMHLGHRRRVKHVEVSLKRHEYQY